MLHSEDFAHLNKIDLEGRGEKSGEEMFFSLKVRLCFLGNMWQILRNEEGKITSGS